MPKFAEFSEFSYGYALVDNLVHTGAWGAALGAPRFLSLLEEGASGGGYDISLDFVGWPFFLQFKIPQVMQRRSNGMPLGFTTPYFRMHLRTDDVNRSGKTQHEQLMDLEAANPLSVFYVAPAFETTDQLDRFYRRCETPERSEWYPLAGFDPAAPLSRGPHRIAYRQGSSDAVVQSRPFPFKHRLNFEQVKQRLTQRNPVPEHPFAWLESMEGAVARALKPGAKRAADRTDWPSQQSGAAMGRRGGAKLSEGEKVEFYDRARKLAQTVRTRLDAELMLIVA